MVLTLSTLPLLSRYLSTPLQMFQTNKPPVITMMLWQIQNPTPRHTELISTCMIPDTNSPVTGGTVLAMLSMTIIRDTQAKVSLLTLLIQNPQVIQNSHHTGSKAETEKEKKKLKRLFAVIWICVQQSIASHHIHRFIILIMTTHQSHHDYSSKSTKRH